jgi:hypothetical protein
MGTPKRVVKTDYKPRQLGCPAMKKTTKKALNSQELRASYRGGEGGIRTRGKFYPSYAFQAYDLNRSSTSPSGMYCSLGQWSFRSNDSLALKLVAAYAVNTWTIGRKAFKNVLLEHSESRYVLLALAGTTWVTLWHRQAGR